MSARHFATTAKRCHGRPCRLATISRAAVALFALATLVAPARAALLNYVETAVNDVDSSTLAAVSTNQWLEIAQTYSSSSAPASWSSYRFTRWTNSGYPAATYRDPWGRAQNPASFVLQVTSTGTAHYLPATLDADGDGVPDWFEIEYYGTLANDASSDIDGDGLTLLAESTGGTNPLYANTAQAGGVTTADSALITCNLAGYATYTLSSDPAGTVNQSAVVPPGTVVTTTDLSGNASFGYWTLDGVRQQDAWGVALTKLTFTVETTDRTAVAHLFTGDTDSDGVPDAYEQRYYGTLANDASSDTDGDGITLLAEYTGGTNPLYANTTQAGGVAWADSALVTCNLAGYPTYTITSDPAGTVNQSATVPPGTVVTTTDLSGNTSFGYWTLDGVRQQDAWGVAYTQLTFTMGSTDRAAVAHLFTGDTDGDGVPDAYEQRYYGTLTNGASSDTDGDGVTLLAEYTGGTSPLYANSSLAGGVAWADSSLVTADLQAEIGVEQPAGTDLTDGGSQDFGSVQIGGSISLTFTIVNHGGLDLTGLTLTVDGTDAAEFGVTANPVAPVAHDGTTTFTLRFAPASAGAKTAAVHLSSNDANENPFDLTLTGTGTRLPQTIAFDPLADIPVYAVAFGLGATASSGLPVTYASSNPNVATVSGNVVTLKGAGDTTITASQAGNATYLPAADVSQNLHVYASQTITADESNLDSALASGAPEINFSADGTITCTTTKTIAADLTLDGTGHAITLSGGDTVRLFTVNPGVHLTLRHLTLSHGSSATAGGAIYNNGGTVTLVDCTFSNNATVGAANSGTASGGAIYNDTNGGLEISNCTFANNSAVGGTGATGGSGGGTGGTGGYAYGGAICNHGGTVDIVNSTFSSNQARGGNGGQGGRGYDGYQYWVSTGWFSGYYSTVYGGPGGRGGNGGNGFGGNIFNVSGPVNLTNVTVARGAANPGYGGGGGYPGNYGSGSYGSGYPGNSSYGGNIGYTSDSVSVQNTIIAYGTGAPGNNCTGTLIDKGHNICSDTSAGFSQASSPNGTDPRLASDLANNGGATQTIALLSTSPVIDAGDDTAAPATDQRGLARSGQSDIGAYEFQLFAYTINADNTVTVTGYSGSGSSVTIPATIAGLPVIGIGTNAFYNSVSLTSVTLPSGLTTIGGGAFYGCSNLTTISIPASVTSIGSWALARAASLTAITVDAANTVYQSVDSVLFDKGLATLLQYPGGKTGAYVVPAGVTSIGNQAFAHCANLTGINFASSVTSLGVNAFQYCVGLSTVTVPDNVTTLGGGVFSFCTNLTSATIGNQVTRLSDAAFQGCSKLTSVTVGNHVTSVGNGVFYGCTSLASVNFEGNAPSLSAAIFDGSSNATVYYLQGTTGWMSTYANRPTVLLAAPAITAHPTGESVNVGADVTFTVTATGTAPLTYQWRLDGQNLTGATSDSLALSNVQAADAGSYTVVITNDLGSATSDAAVLTVSKQAQTISFAALPAKTIDDGPFTLSATASSSLAVSYASSDPSVATVSGNTVTIVGIGTTTITASQAGDAMYLPAVDVGQTLTVTGVLPVITAQPSNQTVNAGSNATFAVTASSGSTLSYQWQVSTDAGNTWSDLSNDSTYSGVTTTT